ncbi:flagellin [Marinovum algicola]|uniref:flagellin n=1 Tax=Marinovum algicola TaxID=42444 RepID=UPI0024BA0DEB|nr:flagellin [Marinovum algicola]
MIYNMTNGPSTLYSNLLRRNTNAELQNRLAQAEQELATGVQSDIYASLSASASEALALNAALDRDAAQVTANTLLGGRFDSMSRALGTIRESVQPAFDLAVANSTVGGSTGSGLQLQARVALDALIGQANATHAGLALFSGSASDTRSLTPWDQTSTSSGETPGAAIGALLAQGMGTGVEVTARIAEMDALFDNADGSFDALFDTGGGSAVTVNIGDGETLRLDVQANDPAFRDVLQGLAMLAATDAQEISDPSAYADWVGAATARLASGMEGLLDSQVRLDAGSARIDAANTRMQDRALVYSTRVSDLIGVDSYQAATEITALETQLQASYAVTARLSQLSFLNYMG